MSGPSFDDWAEQKGFEVHQEEGTVRFGSTEGIDALNEDNKINVDESEFKEINLPPDPRPLREWCEQDQRYSQSLVDMPARLSFKLLKTWVLWTTLITNTKVIELLHTKTEDEDSPEYHAKSILFEVIDHLGKILADTDCKQELAYLSNIARSE